MKTKLMAAAVVAGLASPVAAATLDFTTTPNNLAGVVDGVGYQITGSGTLTNATHDTNLGCSSAGWMFACASAGSRFDVGFGVNGGGNNNEVDGIRANEYVQVAFTSVVKLLGFAGMLTYKDSASSGTERVILEYSSDGGKTFQSIWANPLNDDNDPGNQGDNKFDTVGLAYLDNLSLFADVVRFRAGGVSPFDDGNTNVTAAGLQVAAVPVPAAFPLLLGAIGALGWVSRRRAHSTT